MGTFTCAAARLSLGLQFLLFLRSGAAERHVTVGRGHLCFITSGSYSAACAGQGWHVETSGPFHGVAAGNGFTCGLLMTNHTVTCWNSSVASNPSVPPWVAEIDKKSEFLDISAGERHMCGLLPNGTVSCFGGTRAVPVGGPGYTTVAAGIDISCGIARAAPVAATAGGEIRCWSDSPQHPLLNGIPRGPWLDISIGDAHACALSCNGSMACWGAPQGYDGLDLAGDYIYISAGGDHTCAITSDYNVRCNRLSLAGFPFATTGVSREVAAGGIGVASLSGGGVHQVWTSFNTTLGSLSQQFSPSAPPMLWSALASSANGLFLVAATTERIFTSSDGGLSWTPRDQSRPWKAVASSADGLRLIAAAAGH